MLKRPGPDRPGAPRPPRRWRAAAWLCRARPLAALRRAAAALRGVRLSVRLRLALLSAATAIGAGALVLGVTSALLIPTGFSARFVARGAVAGPDYPSGACLALLQKLPSELGAAKGTSSGPQVAGAAPVPSADQQALAQCFARAAGRALVLGGVRQSTDVGRNTAVLVNVARAQRSADVRQFVLGGGIALALLALLALGGGWWVAGRILGPLQVMTRRVHQLSAQTPLGRIGLAGPRDELRELADTFDGLLGRLDAALAAERRFVANASHELRTPLAIQQTLLDVALSDPDADAQSLREMAQGLRQVNTRSRRLIEGLLALARSERGPARAARVDLAAAARAAIDAGEAEAAARGVRIEQAVQPAPVHGDAVLLERLAANLVENAVRYNVPGGWVRVGTAAEGGRAVLTVANTGPAVDPAELAGLFEPFRRGARDRTDTHRGAGLGLSIVRAVAGVHGGTVEAEARPEGGLVVTVALPLADPAGPGG